MSIISIHEPQHKHSHVSEWVIFSPCSPILSPLLSSPLRLLTNNTNSFSLVRLKLFLCRPGPTTTMAGPVLFMKSLFNSPLQLGLNSNGKFNYIREVSSLFLKQLAFYGGTSFYQIQLEDESFWWKILNNILYNMCLIFRMFSMFLYSFYSGEYQ